MRTRRWPNGSIYCALYHSNRILKIHTNDGTVKTLDNVELPETGRGLPVPPMYYIQQYCSTRNVMYGSQPKINKISSNSFPCKPAFLHVYPLHVVYPLLLILNCTLAKQHHYTALHFKVFPSSTTRTCTPNHNNLYRILE
jgi:hypothetical protein